MKLELALYKNPLNYDELQQSLYLGQHHGFSCFSIFVGYAGKAGQFTSPAKLAAIIDYPFGNSPTSLRLHEIMLASRAGIGTIDLVINSTFIENNDKRSINEDLKACCAAASSNKLQLRAVIEYRLFSDEKLIEFTGILRKLGILDIISTTGMVMDDIIDNLIVSNRLSMLGFNVTVASNTWTANYFKSVRQYNLAGVRFYNANVVKSILGSY